MPFNSLTAYTYSMHAQLDRPWHRTIFLTDATIAVDKPTDTQILTNATVMTEGTAVPVKASTSLPQLGASDECPEGLVAALNHALRIKEDTVGIAVPQVRFCIDACSDLNAVPGVLLLLLDCGHCQSGTFDLITGLTGAGMHTAGSLYLMTMICLTPCHAYLG